MCKSMSFLLVFGFLVTIIQVFWNNSHWTDPFEIAVLGRRLAIISPRCCWYHNPQARPQIKPQFKPSNPFGATRKPGLNLGGGWTLGKIPGGYKKPPGAIPPGWKPPPKAAYGINYGKGNWKVGGQSNVNIISFQNLWICSNMKILFTIPSLDFLLTPIQSKSMMIK